MRKDLSQEDLTRKPTQEELDIIRDYAGVGIKPRYVAAKLGIPVDMMIRNENFLSEYEKRMAEAIREKMMQITECVNYSKTIRNAQLCISILEMWGVNQDGHFLSRKIMGTYENRMDALDSCLARQEISIHDYKELAIVQAERFKFKETIDNFSKLDLVVEQITNANKKLADENEQLLLKTKMLSKEE